MINDFDSVVETAIKLYEEKIGQFATRTWQMIERYGKIEALSRLVVSADLQSGFKVLRDNGLLEYTFEAIVVKYKDKFKPNIVEAAQWRIQEANRLLEK